MLDELPVEAGAFYITVSVYRLKPDSQPWTVAISISSAFTTSLGWAPSSSSEPVTTCFIAAAIRIPLIKALACDLIGRSRSPAKNTDRYYPDPARLIRFVDACSWHFR